MTYMQLRWDNWNEMCDFAGVGRLDKGQPEGCWLDELGLPTHTPRPDINRIGLVIPTKDGVLIARQTDFVVRHQDELLVYPQGVFEKIFKHLRRQKNTERGSHERA